MAGVRRHRAEGGYPRGEETRARIVGTALALFGQKGFDGVSTREIATQAGVPAPSLQYYFENKQGLYLACIEHMQATAMEAVRPALESAEALLTARAHADRLIDAYCSLLDRFADFLIGAPDAESRALFVARRDMPSEAAVRHLDVQNMIGLRLQRCCTELVARIAGGHLTDEETRLIVTTVNGQLLGIYLARNHLKTLTGWEDITPERLQTLKGIIRKQTTVLLNAYHP